MNLENSSKSNFNQLLIYLQSEPKKIEMNEENELFCYRV